MHVEERLSRHPVGEAWGIVLPLFPGYSVTPKRLSSLWGPQFPQLGGKEVGVEMVSGGGCDLILGWRGEGQHQQGSKAVVLSLLH